MELEIGQEINVAAWWQKKEVLRCKILGFWMPNSAFVDVQVVDSEVKHVIRKEEILTEF